MSRISHCVPLLMVGLLVFDAQQAHAQPATLTLDDVIRGCQATETRWKGLKDWMLHYRHIREPENPPPDAELDEVLPIEKVNARRGSWFYSYEKQPLSRRANPEALFSDNDEYWILWKDGVCLERQGDDVSVLPEPSLRAYQVFFFTAWLGLDLQSDMHVRSEHLRKIFRSSRPSDRVADMYYLPSCLVEHRADYKVRPTVEVIDGHPCHVIERTDRDVIWIDPAIGFMTRRRLVYEPAGHLAADVIHEGYQQQVPGIWIPSHSTSLAYHPPSAPEEYRTKVLEVVRHVLIDARFNDVPDSAFTVPVPDGVRVHDFIRGITYEKLKPAEDPVQQGLEKGLIDMSYTLPVRRWDWLDVALMVGVGAELIWTGLLIRGRRKHLQPA